jgi:hypothetical protein
MASVAAIVFTSVALGQSEPRLKKLDTFLDFAPILDTYMDHSVMLC